MRRLRLPALPLPALPLLALPLLAVVVGAAIAGTHSRLTVPGYRNPEVRPATLTTTVCNGHGYSSSVRPPRGYTGWLKTALLRYKHLPGTVAGYELDHAIPLSLGGSPYDTRNLWMEPKAESNVSDPKELELWHRLCAGRIGLRDAQDTILAFKRANG